MIERSETTSKGPKQSEHRPVVVGERSDIADPGLTSFERKGGEVFTEKSFGFGGGSSLASQIRLNLGGDPHVTKPFVQNPWVYACVQAVAKAVSSLRLQLRKGEEEDAEIVTSGPLYDLLRRPNPLFSQRKMLRLMTCYHLLHGESFFFLMGNQVRSSEDGGGRVMGPVGGRADKGIGAKIPVPEEMWIVGGRHVKMVQDENTGLPAEWFYETGKGEVRFPAHSVVQVNEADPYNFMRGMGAMTAGMRTAARDWSAERYDEGILQNGGMPGMTITLPEGATLSKEQRKNMRDDWDEGHGKPENAGRPLFLDKGAKAQVNGFSPRDMEFSSMRDRNLMIYMAIFGVTKPIISITDDVNRANAIEATRVFWENTVLPHTEFFADELNTKFISRLDGEEGSYVLGFDTKNVAALRREAETRVEELVKLMGTGRTFHESAQILGIEVPGDLEETDDRFLSSNLRTMEAAQKEADAAARAGEPPAPVPGKKSDEPEEEFADDRPEFATYADEVFKGVEEHEGTLRRKVAQVLKRYILDARKQIEAVAKRSKDDDVETKTFSGDISRLLQKNQKEWEEAFLVATSPSMDRLWNSAGKTISVEIGAPTFIRATDPAALKYLKRKKIKLAEGAMSTLAKRVKDTIVEAVVSDGISTGSTAKRLAAALESVRHELSVMANNTAARAATIARTETTAIVSKARFDNMEDQGIEKHIWLASGDPAVRMQHNVLHRRVVRVGEVFGYGLRYPGDENGSASQVINCRCAAAPVIPE